MSIGMKTVLANVAATGVGALLGDLAGLSWHGWALLAGVITITVVTGSSFVASEASGRRFWSGTVIKIVMGFGAALAVGGNLKALIPALLVISITDPRLLIKARDKFGLGEKGQEP